MSRAPRSLLLALVASLLLFGAGLGVGLAVAPRSIPVAVPASPRVAEGIELGTRHFTEGRFWRAADEYAIVWRLDPENADAERLTFLAVEFAALDTMREHLVAGEAAGASRTTPP